MEKYTFSIQNLAYVLIVSYLSVHILIIAKNILVPLAFAVLFALMLSPLCNKFEGLVKNRVISIIASFLVILLPLMGLIYFFFVQFVDVFQNIDSIADKLQLAVKDIYLQITTRLGFTPAQSEEMLSENISQLVQGPLSYLASTLSSSSLLIINIFLTFIYGFLILLYRGSLKEFYLIQFGKKSREDAEELLQKLQNIIQQYLYGLALVILMLGVLNSSALALIGIDYPLFWGSLAAFLAIIPYVGTTLGGLMPFLFAIATTGTLWQPLAIVAWFVTSQTIEGNLITPNVVGSSIRINPLAALLALIIGGTVWGISGLVLALPSVAVLKILFEQIDILKPVSVLLSDRLYKKEQAFEKKYDKERFRLSSFFTKRKAK